MTAKSNNKKAVDSKKQQAREWVRVNKRSLVWFFLLLLFFYLQAILWIGEGSIAEVWRLKQSISELESENKILQERNQKLISEVEALRTGMDLIEFRARQDLGLIKEGEVFYHVIEDPEQKQNNN